ncbi:MAG: FAD-dependent oxidoreductase [Pseudomonadaceae bacterium]|nr:FAD-dependent oxidoreductase [Pseudomonadaceae bacterium]
MAKTSTIAIVGGGLVGVTAALALARRDYQVTLIDRQAPQIQRGALGMDIRNVALSPASQALLDSVGVWGATPAAPYQHMQVWEQWGNSELSFHAADVGALQLGWLVEVSPLLAHAWQQMDRYDNLTVWTSEISDVDVSSERVEIETATGARGSFDFLIAADGAQSLVRRAMNLDVQQYPVHQVALTTVVKTEQPHQHTAWQRFLTDGPLAFLPAVDEHLCSIVWSQSGEEAERRKAMDEAQFCREIGFAIEHRLGAVTQVDQRFSFPLTQQRLPNCAPDPRVLLIGDAMRVVHPLAGMGVNLGLEDVQQMLEVARPTVDLSAPGLWTRFARQRQVRAQMMIRIFSALQKIYGSSDPGLALLRNIGVASINRLDGLKQQIMREAMGLTATGASS